MKHLPYKNNQQGAILIVVVFTLVLLATIAVLLSEQSAQYTATVGNDMSLAQSRYVAEAGMQHTIQRLQNNNCGTYTGMSRNFGIHQYTVTTTPPSGSPINVQSTGTTDTGLSYSLNRSINTYQPPGAVTLQPGAAGIDNYIKEGDNDRNYGIADKLEVTNKNPDDKRHALIKFDLNTVPAGVEILSARLELYHRDDKDGGTVRIYRINKAWTEGTQSGNSGSYATWKDSAESTPWNTEGGDYATGYYASAAVARNTKAWYSFDITNLTSDWVSGKYPNHGLILVPQGSGVETVFRSSDANEVAERPKLTINYICECGKLCSVPSQQCDANYTPSIEIKNWSTSFYDINEIRGITALPVGYTFLGYTVTSSGAFLTVDANGGWFDVWNGSGSRISFASTPGSNPAGVTFIAEGLRKDHIAVAEYLNKQIQFVNANNVLVNTISTTLYGANEPGGITYISKTLSGTHDQQIAFVDQGTNRIYFLNQSGTLIKSINIADSGGVRVSDVSHISGKDQFMVSYMSKNKIIDFNGTIIREYNTSLFGMSSVRDTIVDSKTCDHILADNGIDRIKHVNKPAPIGTCDGVYADHFNTVSFSGSNGTIDWTASPWQEIGESDGPANSDILVMTDPVVRGLRLRDNNNGGEGAERQANLTGAAMAILDFEYRRRNLDTSSDYVTLKISPNGNAGPWTEIARFAGPTNDSVYQEVSYNITPFISPNTSIQFLTSPTQGDTDEVFIDTVEIRCSP